LYQAPRGTQDILPEEQPYLRFVEVKASELCARYGYERIDTPVFEDARLFTRSVGAETDIVAKEMYTFADRGGDELTLRPEGTAPVCRAYLEHGMATRTKPVKLYYITPIFRYDRPQAGRYRQHHQFGFEAIGEADPAIDAEVIDMAWRFYGLLGIGELTLQLNSIGCSACRSTYLDALRSYYAVHLAILCDDCTERQVRNPLRLLDCKRPGCQALAEAAPKSIDYLCPECRAHFEKLTHYLGRLKLPYAVNHRLVRGLDYYTRTVFEVQPLSEGAQSTLGGGGRYDGLIEALGGPPTPALGFATGIERIIINLKKQGVKIPEARRPDVFIAHIGKAAQDEAVALAARLRLSGIGVLQSYGERSLKAQLRQAGSLGVRYALITGDDEVNSGSVIRRDMTTSEQIIVPLADVERSLGAQSG